MADTKIKLKRTNIPNRVPTVNDIELGELAINTTSGKLYTKKHTNVDEIVEIGVDAEYVAGQDISINDRVISSLVTSNGPSGRLQTSNGTGGFTALDSGTAGQILTTDGTKSSWGCTGNYTCWNNTGSV